MPGSLLFALAILALACSGVGVPAAPSEFEVELEPVENGAPLKVLRIGVHSGAEHPLERGALCLFVGDLSDYYVGRVERGELPATLSERLVPAQVWQDTQDWLTLAPEAPLRPNESYTLAALGYGRLASFQVNGDDAMPSLERVWPPPGALGGSVIVLCGDAVPSEESPLMLEPGAVPARLVPGFGRLADGRRCAAVQVETCPASEAALVLPTQGAGFLLDPAPLRASARVAAVEVACFPGELRVGPACAVPADDRLELFPMPESLLWRLPEGEESLLAPVGVDQPFSLRGLAPDSQQYLAGSVLSETGFESTFEASFRTELAAPHVVLNEVLANPLGPEPRAEWVEIVNDADRDVELAGFTFGDASGSVTLPAALLEAHAYALLVRADFDASAATDVPIAPGTALIRLPALGAKGLSNAGEALWLRDAEGRLLSEFPALAAPHPGVSMARARPDAPVAEASAFGAHAPPGASPGSANALLTAPAP